MKVPKPRKLPSGQWNVRVQVDGIAYSITKPTEKACLMEAINIKSAPSRKVKGGSGKLTLTLAIDRYIEQRENVLSPSTVAGYRRIQRQRFQSAMSQDIRKVSRDQWQRYVNLEARQVSPKTLKNAWCFVAGVIYDAIGERITVTLPQQVDGCKGYLRHTEIPLFLAALEGDVAYIPALLALSSLRMSEILGLRWSAVDLSKGVIYVRETAVRDEDGKLARKQTTKNSSSRRMVPIIQPLREALEAAPRKGVYVVNVTEGTLRRHYQEAAEKAGVPYVGAHGLRHSFASLACYLGLREETAMAIGGWADYHTMKKIYTHVAEEDIVADAATMLTFYVPKSTEQAKTGT